MPGHRQSPPFPHSCTQLVSRILVSSPASGLSFSCPDWFPPPPFPSYPSLTLLLQLLLQSQYFCLPIALGPSLLQSTSSLLWWLLPRSKSLPPAISIPGFIFLLSTFTGRLFLNLPFGPDPFPTNSVPFELSELLAQPSLQPPSLKLFVSGHFRPPAYF